MADVSGQADLRGIDVDKAAKGFADEASVLKGMCLNSPTSAREIRWYQKTSGFLAGTTTTGITSDLGSNTDQLALPTVIEQSWTRQTSYVRKYFFESPPLSIEDIADTDVSILLTNIRDIVRAVGNLVDTRIYNVITESLSPSTINTTAATGNGWDDTSNGNPILDIMTGNQKIRSYGYNPNGAILYINSIEHKNLMNYLITVKGSSIPAFSSDLITKHAVMELLGNNVVVSENATTDYALQFLNQTSCSWKSFIGMKAVTIKDPGIGTTIRAWEEGEALLTDPKSVHLITDTVT
ncbi:MAG: hypothetical protein CMI54_01830 [Parcubacteria group bacterium]|nr:hypothetical protein [Parcubacteria group bacterium]|tara:strand:+ start:6116 stop:7000 length:885 start_codon:yes stop_codon:yes gene_type:complete